MKTAFALLMIVVTLAASAAQLTADQAYQQYLVATALMGHQPAKAPEIRIVSPEKMQEFHPAAKGYTAPDGTIYVSSALDFGNAYDSSILIHEMVHYIQLSKYGDAKDCYDWLERERKAFAIQAYVLERAGFSRERVLLAFRSYSCQ